MKQALTSPQGIAGLLFLVVGFVLGLNYDPAIYKQKDTQFVTDAREYSRIARENLQKGHERDQELVFIWESIGFGILAIGSGWWQVRRKKDDEPTDTEEEVSSVH